MAFAPSAFPMLTALLLVGSLLADAATVTYNFNVTWVPANPDGLYVRPTIGINGQWPLPILRATVGDTVLVVVNNQLGNQSTTLHFHGLYMNGTADMDGPLLVSQCAIVPGQTFTYNFTASPPSSAPIRRRVC
jgi:iron transport multicopper oxidase